MERDSSMVMSIVGKFVDNPDVIWKYLVCPMKAPYSLESLGPPSQYWGNTTYTKIDGQFENQRGLNIKYSFFEPQDVDPSKQFTILYLHSHSACRVEGYHLLRVCGLWGVSLAVFDFAGSGHSDGDHISMGIEEKYDVVDMMQELRKQFNVEHFVIWGRSMGAVTALQAYELVTGVFALVLDSPFGTVNSVYKNAVRQTYPVPGLAIDLIFSYASDEIKKRFGFDVESIRPFDVGPKINIPTVLIGTKDDKIADFEDLLELYKKINVPENLKVIVECKGKHNDDRDIETMQRTLEFLCSVRAKKERQQPSQTRTSGNTLLRRVVEGRNGDIGLRMADKSVEKRWARPAEPRKERHLTSERRNDTQDYTLDSSYSNQQTRGTTSRYTPIPNSEADVYQNRRALGSHSLEPHSRFNISAFGNKVQTNDNNLDREAIDRNRMPSRERRLNIQEATGANYSNPKNHSFKFQGGNRENSLHRLSDIRAPGPHSTRRALLGGMTPNYSLANLNGESRPQEGANTSLGGPFSHKLEKVLGFLEQDSGTRMDSVSTQSNTLHQPHSPDFIQSMQGGMAGGQFTPAEQFLSNFPQQSNTETQMFEVQQQQTFTQTASQQTHFSFRHFEPQSRNYKPLLGASRRPNEQSDQKSLISAQSHSRYFDDHSQQKTDAYKASPFGSREGNLVPHFPAPSNQQQAYTRPPGDFVTNGNQVANSFHAESLGDGDYQGNARKGLNRLLTNIEMVNFTHSHQAHNISFEGGAFNQDLAQGSQYRPRLVPSDTRQHFESPAYRAPVAEHSINQEDSQQDHSYHHKIDPRKYTPRFPTKN